MFTFKNPSGRKVLCIGRGGWRVYLFWWLWDPKNKNFGLITRIW